MHCPTPPFAADLASCRTLMLLLLRMLPSITDLGSKHQRWDRHGILMHKHSYDTYTKAFLQKHTKRCAKPMVITASCAGHQPGLGHCRVLVVALLVHGHMVVGHALLGNEHLFAAVDDKVAALPQSHTETPLRLGSLALNGAPRGAAKHNAPGCELDGEHSDRDIPTAPGRRGTRPDPPAPCRTCPPGCNSWTAA